MNSIIEIIKNLNAETTMDLIIAIVVLAIFDIFSPIFTYVILKLFNFKKSKKEIKDNTFYMPLKSFFRVTGIYLAIVLVRPTFELTDKFMEIAEKVYKVIVTITIANSFANSITKKSKFVKIIKTRSDKDFNDGTTKLLVRILRVIIYIVATFIVFAEIGYDLSGLVTGLGLGTAVLTLAMQDMIKNLLGGFVIYTDKPFKVGDYVKVQNYEGTVEDMTLMSTRIRSGDDTIVQIPNSLIASVSVENFSKMRRRRFLLNLDIEESTDVNKIDDLKKKIYQSLMKNENVLKETVLINFTEIAESSFRILIVFYFNVTSYVEYLELKDNVNKEIISILNQEKVSLAYDTKTIELKQ